MNIQMTNNAQVGGLTLRMYDLVQLPRELYDPSCMTRIGTDLTSAQRAALILWPDQSQPIPDM